MHIKSMKQLLEIEEILRRGAAERERIRQARKEQQEIEAMVAEGQVLNGQGSPNRWPESMYRATRKKGGAK